MRHQTYLRWIIPLIGVLAFLAASLGAFDPTPDQPIPYRNHRGEQAVLNGQGLYRYDTVSSAALTGVPRG